MAGLEALFDAIREAASSAAWSRGVELVRAGAVSEEARGEDEIALHVATPGRLVTPKVLLFPARAEWDCDCGSSEDACLHVCAAVIALRRAESAETPQHAPAASAGRIAYRLQREADGLALLRVIVTGSGETPIRAPLSALAAGRVPAPRFVTSAADLAIESLLVSRPQGRVPRGLLPALVQRLADCPDLTLEGEPVRASKTGIGFRAELVDENSGFRLRVLRERPIDALFEGCIALSQGELCEVRASGLEGRELERYSGRGQRFEADEAARLVAEVLPGLESRMPVEIRTTRLPRGISQPPRLEIQCSEEAGQLAVLPLLVYGDPATARIDAGRLVLLGEGPVPLRDEARERALTQRLAAELALAPGRRTLLTPAAAIELLEALRTFPASLRGDAQRRFFRAAPLTARVHGDSAHFAVDFSTEGDGRGGRASAGAVLAAWRRGENLVALEGGGFAPLPTDWLARFGPRIADLLAARDARGAVPRALAPEFADLCEELGVPAPPDFAALRDLLRTERDVCEPSATALPADLQAELRDYQRRGVLWLARLRDAGLGALLADDMGLGKTLQALAVLRGRSLVVAPTSVLENWRRECERFRPGLRCQVYHGAQRELDAAADLTLTSYALLRRDADALCAIDWDCVVLDEAQNIKNPGSQVARAAHRLRAGFKLALSGTPIENRLAEIWSLFHFLLPGLLGGERDFDERCARPIAAGDAEAAERLRMRLRPFVLRRIKREVAPELPPRTEIVLHVELSEEERRLYDALLATTREEVKREVAGGASVIALLERLLRLRQAACHPALVPGQQASTSAKLEALLERLAEAAAEGHKALVFSQWTALLDRIEPALAERGLAHLRLDGSTRDRAAVVDAFQREEGPPLLLISLKAGGVGLNLTAADHVFLFDPWWNPAVEDQAADRAHRIGQDKPVLVQRLVARDTVEERMLELQERKRRLAEAALGTHAGSATLTADEILALLE